MNIIISLLVGFVAFFHIYVLWLEMFAWTTRGRKVFKNIPADLFEKTKTMAANQGLYNGFLAAGLIWTFFIEDIIWKENITFFFLGCVSIAGIYGAMTVSKRIFFVQGLPALITIVLLAIVHEITIV